jgi:hypothetical protein
VHAFEKFLFSVTGEQILSKWTVTTVLDFLFFSADQYQATILDNFYANMTHQRTQSYNSQLMGIL